MLSIVLKAQHAFIMTVDMCDRCDDKYFADINSFCKERKADTVLFNSQMTQLRQVRKGKLFFFALHRCLLGQTNITGDRLT